MNIKKGDIFTLGKHTIMCGDSTNPEHVNKLLGNNKPQLLIADPPYSSGGFQESSRSIGSIGTTTAIMPEILNDKLSSRGYQSLIKSVLQLSPTYYSYIFTDWRMWVYLFDAVEASGYSVKSQIVWDKLSIGLGIAWRTQHEMIMFSNRAKYKFDNTRAQANIIKCKRSGNKNHPTEKPVELIKKLIGVFSEDINTVYDPFAGSGTTLIACDELGLSSWSMELDPKHVETAIKRYNTRIGG